MRWGQGRNEYDVTLSRLDLTVGTGRPVTVTRRVAAYSKKEAVRLAQEECDAIWVHPWTVVGVYSYEHEFGRGYNT